MGVKGLWKLLECTGQPINPETLEGKILAVDISIWLNQAVKGARDRHGNSVPNAHLLILLHRLCKLLFYRIRPVIVFDGKTPLLKKQTLTNRWQRKELAVKDTKKTTDKLLRTILKQHALKNVLGKSDGVIPSLSQVRRGETDDIFILPSLEKKDKNSSDEEAEKEWEEHMSNENLFQDAFLENPHSIDIESKDFANLPPEVRHEILTDLKEFTKRRRSLLQIMPEESTDFSQYQLTGLLKRNRINQHIEGAQKEMSKEYCGQIQMECSNEGGFTKDMETRRLVSEDASHYILIKGIQSTNSKDTEMNRQNTTLDKDRNSAAADVMSNTGLEPCNDLGSPSLLTARASTTPSGITALPPSPRTVLAIQAAMLESSSDEEIDLGQVNRSSPACGSSLYSTNIAVTNLNSSAKNHHANQQDLQGNEMADNMKKDSETEYDGTKNQRVRTHSANDDHVDEEINVDENELLEKSVDAQTIQKKPIRPGTVQSCEVQEIFPVEDPSLIIGSVNAAEQNVNVAAVGTAEGINEKQKSNELHFQFPDILKEREDHVEIHSLENDGGIILNSKQHIDPLGAANLQDSETDNREILKRDLPSSSEVTTSFQHVGSVNLTSHTQLKGDLDLKSFISLAKENQGSGEETEHQEMFTKNEGGSDSEGSFIEVVIDINKVDFQSELFPPDIFTPLMPANESTSTFKGNVEASSETMPRDTEKQTQAFIQNHMEAAGQQKMSVEVDQHTHTSVGEATRDDWQDLDLGEIEDFENDLLVEQSDLQSQKQQQERIAATVTGQMYLESQEMLRLFGIPYIVAPMEAEAQCAYLDLTDQTSGTITDDSDIWLFGARHVYKHFFSQHKDVEYYQYIHFHNQLGLDRTKLINLAYFLGSDYTEGIPGVGYVTAMELLNEFLGPGLEPLFHIRDWWTEAQKNKKLRDNPNDTKVKRKLRHLDISPGFPNPAVAEDYLKPVVDESKISLSWGKPDLDEIREFCENRFGWTRKKTDEVLLPVMKQVNAHQSQLRIDSFFRMEQHEKQAIKSQRLRRAVTCMLRKEQEALTDTQGSTGMVEAAGDSAMEGKSEQGASGSKGRSHNSQVQRGKRKSPEQPSGGGFIQSISLPKMSDDSERDEVKPKHSKVMNLHKKTPEKGKTAKMGSSSSDESDDHIMVTARPVFEKRGKLKTKQRKKLRT
ncbi:DNA excision repair protein ERCC-5 homolog isoform X1 [Chiloscyllium punctatum]|uniref:DNA excision repair protein ERCC-5 homolog isoform X1 n=1 Tax=Chiloscyllium punctatum TaxID=137246 RepID=UPI003B632098